MSAYPSISPTARPSITVAAPYILYVVFVYFIILYTYRPAPHPLSKSPPSPGLAAVTFGYV